MGRPLRSQINVKVIFGLENPNIAVDMSRILVIATPYRYLFDSMDDSLTQATSTKEKGIGGEKKDWLLRVVLMRTNLPGRKVKRLGRKSRLIDSVRPRAGAGETEYGGQEEAKSRKETEVQGE